MRESEIVRDVLRVLGGRADMRCWRQNCGVGRTLSNGAVVRFGIIGGADVSGILSSPDPALHGKRLEIELKTGAGRQSSQQKQFQTMITLFGGVYIVARSAHDALTQLRARGYCGTDTMR